VSGLLREVASHLTSRADPNRLIERALARGTDRVFSCESPLGEIYVGVSDKGVRLVGRTDSPEEFARRYRMRFGRLLSWGTDARTRKLAERMAAALSGEKIEVPVDLSETTPFQRRVLEVVAGIPRGEVRPYAWVAREAGSPNASRAVGTAMANNPVPLLVPCHRVIRNDGTTGRYAFGAKEKVGLLEAEGVPVGELAGSRTSPRRLRASSATPHAATPGGFVPRTVGRSGPSRTQRPQDTGPAGCADPAQARRSPSTTRRAGSREEPKGYANDTSISLLPSESATQNVSRCA
jgi:methylated-DNA-[protein]-cysteine S-methyltransferase